MNSSNTSSTECETPCTDVRYNGRVKWFNNRSGYGFVTILNHDKKDSDVFVHHSAVRVADEQFKYLVQGEYIELSLTNTPGAKHELQASDISGISGGKLMCETRNEFKASRTFEHTETLCPPRHNREDNTSPRKSYYRRSTDGKKHA